jgi:hypothetical protein
MMTYQWAMTRAGGEHEIKLRALVVIARVMLMVV